MYMYMYMYMLELRSLLLPKLSLQKGGGEDPLLYHPTKGYNMAYQNHNCYYYCHLNLYLLANPLYQLLFVCCIVHCVA